MGTKLARLNHCGPRIFQGIKSQRISLKKTMTKVLVSGVVRSLLGTFYGCGIGGQCIIPAVALSVPKEKVINLDPSESRMRRRVFKGGNSFPSVRTNLQ